MPLYSVRTRKSPEKVFEKAKDFFGEGGLGLELSDENPCCVTFEGGGGYVSVSTVEEEGKTEVGLETREWDYHVKKFMNQI